MEQNIDNKIELKDRLLNLYNNNKLKIIIITGLLIITVITIIILDISKQKENRLIADKYVEAGLLLSSKKKDLSRSIYEEIIYSKNEFYSILSLNTILEKNLVSDKSKILQYFEIVENLINNQEQKDLIIFKKALFLIKIENISEGNQGIHVFNKTRNW